MEQQEHTCHYCGVFINYRTGTIDHIHPKINGGQDSLDNFVLACQWCNQTKTDYTQDWFKDFISYLFVKSKVDKKHTRNLSGFPIRKPNPQETGRWIARYNKLLKKRSCDFALDKVKSDHEASESIFTESETSLP